MSPTGPHGAGARTTRSAATSCPVTSPATRPSVTRPRVALVTGANKGIGRAVARQLGERGMRVYLGARDEERGRTAERELREGGLDARCLRLDVTDESTVGLAAKRIEEESGRLDVLVNNAGVGSSSHVPSRTSADEVRQTFETNVFGVVTVINALLPLLRRSDAGRIVNISSMLGSLTALADDRDPTGALPPGSLPPPTGYSTSKAALNALTVLYARELHEDGILVNAACPGFVATDINGGQGHLTPDQGARIPVLLATLPEGGRTATFIGSDGSPAGVELPW
ncbi:SDR family oxidoreductase [Streptomyces hebeiensis]|uniref:SDR family oxidoreductase n=1 Tax=Streptomyces hebeiensis TaxID=229486 RepID=A0ABP4FMR4_9ACTN